MSDARRVQRMKARMGVKRSEQEPPEQPQRQHGKAIRDASGRIVRVLPISEPRHG